jgi:hypothetical protein
MRRRHAGVLVALTLVTGLGALVVRAEPAWACTCAAVSDQEAFDRADVVFTGEWVETDPGVPAPFDQPDEGVRLLFEVDEVYAGHAFERQSVVSWAFGESCGLQLDGAGPYLVFARTTAGPTDPAIAEGEVVSDLCSGTRPLVGGAVPTSFGQALAPRPGTSPVGGERPLGVLLAVAVGGGAVVGVVALVRARRSSTQGPDGPAGPDPAVT